MARTLSEDLRSRLITAVEGGMSRCAAADRFGVAAATAVRWVGEWCATGATRAKAKGGDLRSGQIEVVTSVNVVEFADGLRVTTAQAGRGG
ncbi:hypothetical protein JMJ56_32430, partial [Belnapia sp. T18]|nr:hypothetical protein [Belnapia arida]